jgi:hypothetical protein
MKQEDDCGCESDWSATAAVTVSDVEIPAFFVSGCADVQTAEYRIIQLPLTVRSGNPQAYTVTFADLSRSAFNHQGAVRKVESGGFALEVHLPLLAGDYALTVQMDGCQYPTVCRVLADASATGGALLIDRRWDDVLSVNNNPEMNGGFVFYAYQWYKNGQLIPGATQQYYTEPDGKLNGSYHVALEGHSISSSGDVTPVSFVSCPYMPLPQMRVSVYPVPVKVNQPFTFTTTLTAEELDGATLELYNATGKLTRKLTNLTPQMHLDGFEVQGFYFGRIITRNNGLQEIKIIVQ